MGNKSTTNNPIFVFDSPWQICVGPQENWHVREHRAPQFQLDQTWKSWKSVDIAADVESAIDVC